MAEVRRAAVEFESQFTQVPNVWVRDARLSRRARGLMVELFSHSIGWVVTEKSLIDGGPEGRDALRSALRELEEFGYLVREQGQDAGGRFESAVWATCNPFSPGQTVDGFTGSGLPVAGKSAPYIRTPIIKKNKDKNLVPDDGDSGVQSAAVERGSGDAVSDAFEAFWACYPVKKGKRAAEKAFALAVARVGNHTPILEGARRLRDDPNLPTGDDRRFIKHPSTWLNQDCWEDDALPARAGGVLSAGRGADAILAEREADAEGDWRELES